MTDLLTPTDTTAYTLTSSHGGLPHSVPCRAVEAEPADLVVGDPLPKPWEGFGICFNECGWEALSHLDADAREELLRDLFSGGAFPRCRMPIGANDYALSWYSLDEEPGDLALEHFSLDRDRETLLPYIRAAMRYEPSMTLFASPWSPPTWMKEPPVYNYGRLRQDPEIRRAYARYFHRFVSEMREEGFPVTDVHVQNEPDSDQKFPSCVWTGETLRDFIRDDLGPLFEAEPPGGRDCGIWLGTIERGDYSSWVAPTLLDTAARRFVRGVGFQWAGRAAVAETHANWPELPLAQTENECGDGCNDWAHTLHVFRLVRDYVMNGVRAYCYWNFVLGHPSGRSTWGWDQNSMVTVDPEAGTFVLNPEYHLMRLLGDCAPPGAEVLDLSGPFASHAVGFRSDQGIRVAAVNPLNTPYTLTLKHAGERYAVELPPASVTAVSFPN